MKNKVFDTPRELTDYDSLKCVVFGGQWGKVTTFFHIHRVAELTSHKFELLENVWKAAYCDRRRGTEMSIVLPVPSSSNWSFFADPPPTTRHL